MATRRRGICHALAAGVSGLPQRPQGLPGWCPLVNIGRQTNTQSEVSSQNLAELMSQMNFGESRPPLLNCGTFTRKEKDKFAFNTFMNQFNNVFGSRKNLNDAAKLVYLIAYLRDFALCCETFIHNRFILYSCHSDA